MVPPEGSGPRRLPTLSWDSIVDDSDTTPPASPADPVADGSGTGAPPESTPDTSEGIAPMTLGAVPPAATPAAPSPTPPATAPATHTQPSPPAPPAPPIAPSTPRTQPSSPPSATPPAAPAAAPSTPAPSAPAAAPLAHPTHEPVDVRTERPSPVTPRETPVVGDDAVEDLGTADAEVVSTELPQIREATPVPELDPADTIDDSGNETDHDTADETGSHGEPGSDPADDTVTTGVVPAVGGPVPAPEYRLPTVPQPDQRHIAPPAEVSAFHAQPASATRPRRRSRSGIKVFLALVVLGGLVAAGIVFGRPYLFPDEWDAAAEPHALAVESAAGAEYVDTFLLVPEPTDTYTDRMTNVLTGDWTTDAPEWRALGLVSGEANAENVTLLLEEWHHAVHDPVDGQVYHDAARSGPQLDAEVTRAFASALLDQQYSWSAQQPARTLDDAAWTLAEVQRQSARIQAASSFPADVAPRATAALSFLPPVLAYEVLAPATFAAFDRPDLPDAATGADNPLRQLGTDGPGPVPADVPVAATAPVALEGDTITGTPQAVDRSFWYLVLAGYLDTRTAYEASEAIVESSTTLAERVANRCVYATFSGGDVEQTATLRAALETWAATVPLEMSATFSVLPDGTLQLVSCDPGSRFENGARIGVGRELIGWRMAEAATTLAVTANGGSAEDAAAAWAVVEASNVPVDLANLPFDTAPADAAATAVSAVAGVLPPAGG